jgi:AcrR family transcriptional regulator
VVRPAKPIDPERDERLVVVAADRFATVGYEATSLNQVLSAAGWQKSSFYHYFADKSALHDHVVETLAGRLLGTASPPELAVLTSDTFWPSMADFLAALGESAQRSPETRFLGEMFHRGPRPGDRADEPSGQLSNLRTAVADWLTRAVLRGRSLGVIRDDLPEELLIEITMALLQTLDAWAVRHALHSPGGPWGAGESLQLVRDLIEQRPSGQHGIEGRRRARSD